jgi:peptidase E
VRRYEKGKLDDLPSVGNRKGSDMPNTKGTIVLMGSGELTATMVEVHKALLRPFGKSATAAFVDTPAGFQLNVDHIYRKAAEYFDRRVRHSLKLASFKSASKSDAALAEPARTALRRADYVLIGPGSPTYALQQWQHSPLPGLMIDLVERGGCLVAASAAALTVGRTTLPVYEIYKVGQPVHWVDGLNLLGHFGFNLAVIPHWNNAEGGNHDTRFCFMGELRLAQLEEMLPDGTAILGVDEHTALIIDLEKSEAAINGVGQVTLRHLGREYRFRKGDPLPLSLLRGEYDISRSEIVPPTSHAPSDAGQDQEDGPWAALHALAGDIREALDLHRDEGVAGRILELERTLWENQVKLNEINEMGAAREILREVISLMAAEMSRRPESPRNCMTPLVEGMIALREQFRSQKEWAAADAVRDALCKAGVTLSDTPGGTEWSLDGQ